MKTVRLLSTLALGFLAFGCGDGDSDIGADSNNLTEIPAEGSKEALALLAVVNDGAVDAEELDGPAKLDRRAASNIIDHRNGADGVVGTADDDVFDTIKELDEISYVGPAAFRDLLKYAKDNGYLSDLDGKEIDVIFSPQPAEASHNAKIAAWIDEAQSHLDIAMYSFSDAGINAAIERAVDRGVKVRFVFESANKDRRAVGNAKINSASGRLEQKGVDVRYVNKIMHHKWVIIDGPRDEASMADTARVVSGSANWSNGAATRYDENTVFMSGFPEIALKLQREFNLMWEHSREFSLGDEGPYELSTLAIEDAMIPDDAGQEVFVTSDNFSVTGTTFKSTGENTVASALVDAIQNADERIWVASGHLRSRPVSEALIAKRQENPNIDIKVYLDSQEYISSYYHQKQLDKLDECLADASTESQTRSCMQKGFLFGYQLGLAGVDTRYKYYAYRWDFSYALQMHNKFLIIDDALFTGSYNLSDNAEQNTFENVMMFRGPEFNQLIEKYVSQFEAMWITGDGLLPGLEAQIQSGEDFPIVFDSMALSWDQIAELKSLISANCPQINSTEYRQNAASHKWCDL